MVTGSVSLKCEVEMAKHCADIAFRIGVGRQDTQQEFRGPIVQNFFDHCLHGLPENNQTWELSGSVEANKCLTVTVEVATKSALDANPDVWWDPLVALESAGARNR